jgi:hypothetical protein
VYKPSAPMQLLFCLGSTVSTTSIPETNAEELQTVSVLLVTRFHSRTGLILLGFYRNFRDHDPIRPGERTTLLQQPLRPVNVVRDLNRLLPPRTRFSISPPCKRLLVTSATSSYAGQSETATDQRIHAHCRAGQARSHKYRVQLQAQLCSCTRGT